MVFSSLFFSFFFLPFVITLYYLSKEKYRNYILLASSLCFYGYGEPKFVFVMIGSIILNYAIAILISAAQREGRVNPARLCLAAGIAANIGILFMFKYLDLFISTTNTVFGTGLALRGIRLPIGISFFTFQAMSYIIDVYRKHVGVQKNIFYLALYISFFPQLIAGPIVRYSSIEDQITNRTCTLEKYAEGVRRFFIGFGKKVIIANNLAVIAEEIFAKDYSGINSAILWIGSICFSLQIFFDFSGYSDMAIGLGKIFGFEFEENFNFPYMSRSVTEFWRRWHISLGQWFRDYVYIPLGGSRGSVPRHIINMLIVWLLTGIWHGANYTFLLWGFGYFVLLIVEKYIVKPENSKNPIAMALWQIVTLLCVNFGWVIFNSPDIKSGVEYCMAMLGICQSGLSIDADLIRYVREFGFFMIIGILLATPVMRFIKNRIDKSPVSHVLNIVTPVLYGLIFLWGVSYMILGTHNPFIYFRF